MVKGNFSCMPLLKKHKDEQRKNFTLRLSPEEIKALQVIADRYTNGNVSKWIRYASFNYQPKKSELG